MNTALDCIPCFIRQALEAVRLTTDDPAVHDQVLRDALAFGGTLNLCQPPPAIGQQIHRRIRELTGQEDPYRAVKDRFNNMAIDLLPDLRERIKTADDPFAMAVRLAIVGNIIDLGVKSSLTEQAVLKSIDRVLDISFHGDIQAFKEAVAKAESILYLTDNAGEIILDRLLIERLPLEKTTVAVRGKPIINDATQDDAQAAGLDELVEVIDNGSDVPGTILSQCSEEFRRRFRQADLIIAKGQGNFETLCDEHCPIFFLFQVKCPVMASRVGLDVGTQVLLSRQAASAPVEEGVYVGADSMDLPADLRQAIEFHGHLCPGLVIGYCAAKAGMQRLGVSRSGDEEIIAIVENDTCAIDAIQFLSGCTVGKGNLFFRDYGKMIFTLASRQSGHAVRLSVRHVEPPGINQFPENERREHMVQFMLSVPPEQLFDITEPEIDLPEKARIHQSIQRDACGERAMETRIRNMQGNNLCLACTSRKEHTPDTINRKASDEVHKAKGCRT